MDFHQIYSHSFRFQTDLDRYYNVCKQHSYYLNIYTIIGVVYPHYDSSLKLKYSCTLNQDQADEAVYIRNIQVLIQPCHNTCLTCSGPLIENCLSCHYGVPNNGKCDFCNDPSFRYTHNLYGCLQECPEQYIADQSNYCVQDQKIFQLFSAYQGSTFLNQDFTIALPSKHSHFIFNDYLQNCNSKTVSGFFNQRNILKQLLYLPKGTSLLRLRSTIYFFNNWVDQEELSININSVQIESLIYNGGNIQIQNGKIIYKLLNQVCNSHNYDLIRIETLINIETYTFDVLLSFQTILLQNSISTWGIRDVTIDAMVCSFNCYLCKNQQNCQTCESGFKLHKGQCVQVCPTYSTDMGTTCKDFDEETDMTVYEVKAFFDLSTDDETANNMFTLVSENPPNFSKGSSIYFSYLINKRIFGGTLVWRNAKFQKLISISEPHYGIRIRMNVILGDDFMGGSFIYTINSIVTTLTRSTFGGIDQQIWGAIDNEYQLQVDTYQIDNDLAGSYTFEVECLSSKDINIASCGISDLFITVYRCPFQCNDCDDEYTCNSYFGSANFDPLLGTCSDGYYKDFAQNDCVQCQLNHCLKCDDLYTCIECDSTFTLSQQGTCICLSNQVLILGQCFDCHSQCMTCTNNTKLSCLSCNEEQNRYLVNAECVCLPNFYSTNDECQPICGDMVAVGNEECDDGNQIRFDGCHMCRYECQQECDNCHFGLCYKCAVGYTLNLIIHKCFKNKEMPQMHLANFNRDSMNQDNSHINLFDVCHSAYLFRNIIDEHCTQDDFLIQFYQQEINNFSVTEKKDKCSENCSECTLEFCLQCKNGFQLENNICILYVGLIANLYNMAVQNFALNIANSECSDNCSFCSMGSCLQCFVGWHLSIITGQCESICGDGLIVGIELCDDGNDVPYDGCYQCEYQCQEECEYCFLGVCQECAQGWSLNNSKCRAICGDGVVNGNEQCDDGNDIPYDGCFQCTFQCDESCLDCYEGLCIECEVGYFQEGSKCYSICGDGQLAGRVEECDDANTQDGDGCSSECTIEEGWSCSSGQQLCEISSPPLMYLDIVEDGEELKKVQIKFTQKLIQTKQPQFSLTLNSNELSKDDVTIVIEPLTSASYLKFMDVIYEVTVTFNKNCLKSELIVELIDQMSLTNDLKQPISNSIAKAKLKQTNFLDETQKQVSTEVSNTVNRVFYGLLILSAISLLSGNLNIMWNTLDLLQFLSYLKYINVPFPINLQYFFKNFDQVTFGPILDITGFRQFVSLLSGADAPYVKPSTRFADVNALLIENIQSLLFVILVGHIIHYLQIVLLTFLSKIELSRYLKSNKFNFAKIILFIKSELKQEIKAFYFSELIRLFLSSSYELHFAIYLQINNLHFTNAILSINSVLSILLLFIVCLISIHILFNSNDYLAKHNTHALQQKVKSLFEDVSTHSYLSRVFNSLFLIKRNIFMLILIFCQNTPIPQTFLVAITSGIFLIYLVIQHPQNNNYNQFNMLVTEIVVQLCCFIFILFEINNNFIQLFDFAIYLNLGWVCIGLISGCLICQFGLDLYQQILILKIKFHELVNQINKKFEKKKNFKLCESTNQEQIQIF